MTGGDPERSRARLAAVATLVACAAVVLLARVRLYAAPLHGDICAYAVIGHEMTVGGRPLYSDLWERKPPLLYLTFAAAERVVGYGRPELLLAGVLAAWATLAGTYAAGAGGGGARAGLFAAGLWALLSADLWLTANQPEPETFINAALIGAVAILIRWPNTTARRSAAAAAVGVLLAAATLYKHNAALACAAILAGHVATCGRRWPAAVAEATLAGGVIVLAWAALLAHAYHVGRLDATLGVLFHQNVAYSHGSFGHNLLVGLSPDRLFPPFLLAVLPPALLVVAYGVVARSRRRAERRPPSVARRWGLLLAWAIGTWATVALTGMVYAHYDQLWLPIACVAGGWAAAELWRSRAGTVVVGLALAAMAVRQGGQFLLTPDQWVQRQFPYYSVANQNEMARRLNDLLRPGETFWAMGNDNALYFLTRRSPPSGLLYLDPLLYGGDTDRYWRRLQSDLERRPPDLVIFSTDWTRLMYPPKTPIYPWIDQHYRRWQTWTGTEGDPRATTYLLYVRRGGPRDTDQPHAPAG
jgi:hypothetical protein